MDCSCQCNTITFRTPLPAPLDLYICHCLECQKQSSSAFGISASFPTFTIDSPHLRCYSRQTATGQKLDCYFCGKCGSRLMHKCEGEKILVVKGGCIQGLRLEGVKHIWCKRAVVPIPDGVERFEEEPPDEEGS